MNNEILQNLKDSEKLMIFNIALEQAKEKNVSFESQIGIVINAFLISKKEIEIEEQRNNTSPYEMNMAPSPQFGDPIPSMNMAPRPEFINQVPEMNMAPRSEFRIQVPEMNMTPSPQFGDPIPNMNMEQPKKNNTDTDIYGGPYPMPMDTQRVDNDYRVGI